MQIPIKMYCFTKINFITKNKLINIVKYKIAKKPKSFLLSCLVSAAYLVFWFFQIKVINLNSKIEKFKNSKSEGIPK